jgi:2-methylisocitrate lyase-like PEP mutase family enzyme
VLPNAWDAASARIFAACGAEAVGTTSMGVAAAAGLPDIQQLPLDDMLRAVARIAHAVDVPVTADMEAGYGVTTEAVVASIERAVACGAVGINIEDGTGDRAQPLIAAEVLAERIAAIRAAMQELDLPLVINARTDVFLGRTEVFDDPLAEAIRRLRACEEAGARCVYPVRAPDAAAVRTLLDELTGPINVIAHPVNGSTAGSLDDLRALGVHRVSFGPFLQMTLTGSITDLVTPWIR